MTSKTKLLGIPKWQVGLNQEIKKIEGATESGLLAAALFIKGESMKEAPVATGNLRNSSYVVSSSGKVVDSPDFDGPDQSVMSANHTKETAATKGEAKARKRTFGPSAYIGYSALYALSVHENPRSGKTGGVSPSGQRYSSGRTEGGNRSTRVMWAEKGKWKFLEDPMKRHARKIVEIIKMRARIR